MSIIHTRGRNRRERERKKKKKKKKLKGELDREAERIDKEEGNDLNNYIRIREELKEIEQSRLWVQ